MSGNPQQQPDSIASGKIIVVGIVSVIVFIIGIVWAARIMEAEEQQVWTTEGRPTSPLLVDRPEIGIVYQRPFDQSRYAADKAAQKQARLRSYGWVDRQHQIIHIPVEQAMQQLAGGRP